MKSFIFRCNTKTKSEVFSLKLLGEELAVWGSMSMIKPEDYLFLYDTSAFEVTGPLKPSSLPAQNIDPSAWQGRFPVQIRFEVIPETKTIPFTKIQSIIKKFRNNIYPWPELDEEQTLKILELLK